MNSEKILQFVKESVCNFTFLGRRAEIKKLQLNISIMFFKIVHQNILELCNRFFRFPPKVSSNTLLSFHIKNHHL